MHIVITGASRGIGAELTRVYCAQGHRVTGTSTRGGAGLLPLDLAAEAPVLVHVVPVSLALAAW